MGSSALWLGILSVVTAETWELLGWLFHGVGKVQATEVIWMSLSSWKWGKGRAEFGDVSLL